jgi:hypothetical protein
MHELSQAGMRLLTGRIPGLVSRRLPSPRRSGDARQARSLDVAAHRNRDHDLELSDFTLCLDHWAARHAPTTSILDEYALLERATDPRARKERGWPATASHQGETIDLWVKPDRFLGVHFADRPAGVKTAERHSATAKLIFFFWCWMNTTHQTFLIL